ncbi:MAG TPA: anthranilate phosphoribosyltransferase, partial [Candidatus Wirthbacteria bacterium]|nr:anthranilate phosphoribosyltransferase [Candidatus Wirthbacteria bacterium]
MSNQVSTVLNLLLRGESLTSSQARKMMLELISGQCLDSQIAGLLIALRQKGETATEIAGMAQAMREKARQVKVDCPVFDCCGTGGDEANTFNISTAVALVLAAGGVKVAKHGNRSVSSKCGSADVLEALGIRIDTAPEHIPDYLEKTDFAFMFAPHYHPAVKHVMMVRKALGVRTVFNILGPLCNPASASRQVIGVFAQELTPLIAEVLNLLGLKRALVVHGSGMDEIALHATTQISELRDGLVRTYT